MTKRIFIAGNYGFHNTGDEAILSAMISGLLIKDQDLKFCVVSANPDKTKAVLQVETVFWQDINSIIEQVKISDLILIGGGGIFNDYWGAQPESILTKSHAGIVFYSEFAVLASLFNKPLMIYAAGVGPLLTQDGRNLTNYSFKQSQQATVRDLQSKRILVDLGCESKNITVTADPCFTLSGDPIQGKLILSRLWPDSELPVVAVCLRNWDIAIDQENWQRKTAEALDNLVRTHPCNLVFIPFHNLPEYPLTNDIAAAEIVISYMQQKDNTIILRETLTPEEITGLIANCKLLIGMRLHSIIFAANAAIPIVGLIYDPKVKVLLHQLGLDTYGIDLDQITQETLTKTIDQAWSNHDQVQQLLTQKIIKLKRLAEKNPAIALELLQNNSKVFPVKDQNIDYLKWLAVKQSKLLYENENKVEDLTKGVVENESLIKGLRQDLVEKESAARTQAQELVEKESVARALTQDLVENHKLIEKLNQELVEQKATENLLQQTLADKEIYLQQLSENNTFLQEQILTEKSVVEALNRTVKEKRSAILEEKRKVLNLEQAVVHQKDILQNKSDQIEKLNKEVQDKDEVIQGMISHLDGIAKSRGWKLLQFLWNTRMWIIPRGSKRERLLKWIWHAPRSIVHQWNFKNLIHPPRIFRDGYDEQDNSSVTLFTDNPELKVDYVPRCSLSTQKPDKLKVSLIASIRNERDNVESWLRDIQSQTRIPDEITIVDAGSTDGSFDFLKSAALEFPIPMNLIQANGSSRAEGRNLAIKNTHFPIIAVTDFGCRIDHHWLEYLVRPFIIDAETKVSAGFYRCINFEDQSAGLNTLWANLENTHPQYFLPSARSVAFTRSAIEAVGGFPEWFITTGEDTYLDLELKRLGGKWAFVPEAIVEWQVPATLGSSFKKNYQWAVGDGESGVHARYYWRYVERLATWTFLSLLALALVLFIVILPVKPILLWCGVISIVYLAGLWGVARKVKLSLPLLVQRMLGEFAQVLGFIKGAGSRKEITQRKAKQLKGLIFLLAGVPFADTGGGSRGAQLALELLNQGYAVVYINKFPSYETRKFDLASLHPNLFVYPLSDFVWEKFFDKYPELQGKENVGAIIEFPLEDFFPIIEKVKAIKGKILYDLLDDWQTSLGGDWYSLKREVAVIDASDVLVATVDKLRERLYQISNRPVDLVPNAVNVHLFNSSIEYTRPTDLPENDHTIVYIGALWGDWFDWNLLEKVAKGSKESLVCVIGDYRGQFKNPPQNLKFLGLKPQSELPAYLAFSDVAIIPWKVSKITQNTSPLKVYEYLAMGCPIVASNLQPLSDLPGVFLAKNQNDFVELAAKIDRSKLNKNEIAEFIDQNNWKTRVDQILDLFGFRE